MVNVSQFFIMSYYVLIVHLVSGLSLWELELPEWGVISPIEYQGYFSLREVDLAVVDHVHMVNLNGSKVLVSVPLQVVVESYLSLLLPGLDLFSL